MGWCRTLQGNWYEDREQKTVGTNDGLRCMDVAYEQMMDGQVCLLADLPSCPGPLQIAPELALHLAPDAVREVGKPASHREMIRLTSPLALWQTTFQGPPNEVSMPATQFGNVTTQEPSVRLFSCLKYKHPKQVRH